MASGCGVRVILLFCWLCLWQHVKAIGYRDGGDTSQDFPRGFKPAQAPSRYESVALPGANIEHHKPLYSSTMYRQPAAAPNYQRFTGSDGRQLDVDSPDGSVSHSASSLTHQIPTQQLKSHHNPSGVLQTKKNMWDFFSPQTVHSQESIISSPGIIMVSERAKPQQQAVYQSVKPQRRPIYPAKPQAQVQPVYPAMPQPQAQVQSLYPAKAKPQPQPQPQLQSVYPAKPQPQMQSIYPTRPRPVKPQPVYPPQPQPKVQPVYSAKPQPQVQSIYPTPPRPVYPAKPQPQPQVQSAYLAKAKPQPQVQSAYLAKAKPQPQVQSAYLAKAKPQPQVQSAYLAKAKPQPQVQSAYPAQPQPQPQPQPVYPVYPPNPQTNYRPLYPAKIQSRLLPEGVVQTKAGMWDLTSSQEDVQPRSSGPIPMLSPHHPRWQQPLVPVYNRRHRPYVW